MTRLDGERGIGRAAVVLVLTGTLLALAYNFVGLRSRPSFGLPWVAESSEAGTFELPADGGVAGDEEGSFTTEIDDPMAVFDVGHDDAERLVRELPDPLVAPYPLQMQLPAVKRFFDAGAAAFVDARDVEEFEAGRIPGAVNLPYDESISDPELLERFSSGGKPIITYCGGGTCETSLNLAYALKEAGHEKVLVFMGGYPEWEGAGYAVEVAENTQESEGARRAKTGVVPWIGLAALLVAVVGVVVRNRATIRTSQLVLAGILIVAALAKIGDLESFATQVHNFRLLPSFLENLGAMSLPWIELVAGIALVTDGWPSRKVTGAQGGAGAVLGLAMMTMFLAAVALAVARGLDIECGCFGTADASRTGWWKLLENACYVAVSYVATLRPR